jgi:7,8-dihydroneopterin aldolase/epimerase/oxygenase
MGKIILEDIEVYAYHGCMPEETKVGGRYLVSLDIYTALEEACKSDRITDTFDYSVAYQIVTEEMKIPSSLLEHVAERIVQRLFKASSLIWSVRIRVSKLNPPFGGNVKAVAVELHKERELS